MVRFWVGVSGFSYKTWKGKFYPEDIKSNQLLEAYQNKLNSVEINSSFYSIPNPKVVSKWSDSTNKDFRFSFKANRRITHIKKLKDAKAEIEYLLSSLKVSGEKLGCLLVQLSPYMKKDLEVLEDFLKEVGPVRIAAEFRHESWFCEELYKLLQKQNVALCVADTEDMKPVFEKTADFAYLRLRQDRYSKDELRTWAERTSNFADDATDCYIYFKHDETGDAANVAVEFRKLLQA